MLDQPWFNTGILEDLCFKIFFFLKYQGFLLTFTFVLSVLYLIYRFYKKHPATYFAYQNIFPPAQPKATRKDIPAFLLCIGCFILFIILLYSTENSFFRNFDTMFFSDTITKNYAKPSIETSLRYFPLGHAEWNIFLAITHNALLIKAILVLYAAVILYLLYLFLDFFTVTKRLFLISTLLLTPAVFSGINSMIYPDRNMLIFILLALIALKKYSRTQTPKYLWLSVLFATISLYYKESVFAFYCGILFMSFLYHFKQIKWSHPLQTAQKFPFECLLGLAIVDFFISCGLNTFFFREGMSYLIGKEQSIITMLYIYRYDILLLAISYVLFIRYGLQNFKEKANPMCREGFFVGALFFATIVFSLGILPPYQIDRTYYMMLSSFFCLIYIAFYINRKIIFYCLMSFFLISGAVYDMNLTANEEGKFYGDVARFIKSQNKYPVTLYIADYSEKNTWYYNTYLLAYHFYFKQEEVGLKFQNFYCSPKDKLTCIQYKFINENRPEIGDYYLIKKAFFQKSYPPIARLPKERIYENDLFIIFKIKP